MLVFNSFTKIIESEINANILHNIIFEEIIKNLSTQNKEQCN